MLSGSIFARVAFTSLFIALLNPSARTWPIGEGSQVSTLVELLSEIKSAVERSHKEQTEAYRTVSFRLAQCAIISRMLAEDHSNSQSERATYVTGSSIFFRAASTLYPGDANSFKNVMETVSESIARLAEDKKAWFYMGRNCRDFSERGYVALAVAELLL